MGPLITGIGTATPGTSVPQHELAEVAVRTVRAGGREARVIRSLYEGTQIDRRGASVFADADGPNAHERFYPVSLDRSDAGPSTRTRMDEYLIHAARMGADACAHAMRRAGVAPQSISHLVTVSCTGFCAPGLDIALLKSLALRPTIGRTHVGFMGCHGALNGLGVARAIALSEPGSTVLVCAAEVCSLHFSYARRMDRRIANALFADGAAACIVTAGPHDDHVTWQIIDRASHVVPDTEDLMGWRIGDHGFEMALGEGVPRAIERILLPWMERWLARIDASIEDVGAWAVHPGGPRVLDAVGSALSLDDRALDTSRHVLREHGNMSSPTCLFIVDRLAPSIPPGSLCACLAFGPGLSIEGALLRRTCESG